jgi:hypothetical protein
VNWQFARLIVDNSEPDDYIFAEKLVFTVFKTRSSLLCSEQTTVGAFREPDQSIQDTHIVSVRSILIF